MCGEGKDYSMGSGPQCEKKTSEMLQVLAFGGSFDILDTPFANEHLRYQVES